MYLSNATKLITDPTMKHGTPFSLPGQKVTHDVEIQNNWMNLIERRIE